MGDAHRAEDSKGQEQNQATTADTDRFHWFAPFWPVRRTNSRIFQFAAVKIPCPCCGLMASPLRCCQDSLSMLRSDGHLLHDPTLTVRTGWNSRQRAKCEEREYGS